MLEKLVVHALPLVPGPLMRRLSARYIAGETLAAALERLAALRARGFPGVIDVLGEHVESAAEARAAAATYERAADGVAERGLDAYVSIKPTHVGLLVSEELCYELYARVAEHCARLGLRMRVEMEDHPTTDGTLRVFARLRERYDNVGIVLQSRLLRTPADVDALTRGPLAGRPLDVRMVKGIYLEPARIAHTDPGPIREAYVALCRTLLERGATVAFATHDAAMAEELFALVAELGVAPERYELQVLLGVQEKLWEPWRERGHTVRVYVPYGPDWRAYSTRRLKHNPEILRHVMRAALRWPPRAS